MSAVLGKPSVIVLRAHSLAGVATEDNVRAAAGVSVIYGVG